MQERREITENQEATEAAEGQVRHVERGRLRRLTRTSPIVFAGVSDLVGAGFVADE